MHESLSSPPDYRAYANQVVEQCDSTNRVAKALAEMNYPHGTWVSTRNQTAGRGRLGRTWETFEGNLFISILARIENRKLWSWIPITTAVAVTRFLRTEYSGINFQIKWPNDLWIGGKKLGGILCESSNLNPTAGLSPGVIIGLGLNCLGSPEGPPESNNSTHNRAPDATHLTAALASTPGRGPIHADDVRQGILSSILAELNSLIDEGPKRIRLAYENWAAFSPGTRIEWESLGGITQGQINTGRIEGLGDSAELLVTNELSQCLHLFAEEIRIRKKGSPETSGRR